MPSTSSKKLRLRKAMVSPFLEKFFSSLVIAAQLPKKKIRKKEKTMRGYRTFIYVLKNNKIIKIMYGLHPLIRHTLLVPAFYYDWFVSQDKLRTKKTTGV